MSTASADKLLLHLSLIDGVGPATIKKVVGDATQPLPAIYNFMQRDFCARGISAAVAQKLITGLADTALLSQELKRIDEHNVQWCSTASPNYPTSLKYITQPPVILYWYGQAPTATERMLALVGARKANSYAQRAVDLLVPELVGQGWTTVSGGALGVDSMVHTATVKADGATVAVLGSGLLRPYPLTNKKLFNEIVQCGGTVLSAFPLTMEAMPGNFPARNRIIAGLSRGCVVVQAAQKSGALITAHYALEQGREVFAVPGVLDEPLSAGCHELIRQGATLVRTVDDILLEFGYVSAIPLRQGYTGRKATPHKQIEVPTGPDVQLLAVCRTPASADAVAQALGVDLAQAQHQLFELQLQGKVAQQFTGLWLAQ